MYDVAKLARGARQAYNLAPFPATFQTLARAAEASLTELERDWSNLPSGLQQKYQEWASRAGKYRTRLRTEEQASRKIVDMIASGSLDWQAALAAGSEYAKALNKFFQGGDSVYWAHLANQLGDIKQTEQPTPGWTKAKWLASLWVPWTATSNIAIGEMLDSGSEELSEMADKADQAISEALPDPETFRKVAAGVGFLGLAVAGLAAAWLILRD